MKTTLVIGGGTFNHIRNHLSLAAPAFGSTAKFIHNQIEGSELVLTKMADSSSKLVTNKDLYNFIDQVLLDESIGTIILS